MRPIIALAAALLSAMPLAAMAAPQATLLTGARVLLGDGGELATGDVLLQDGKIVAVGDHVAAPAGARVIDARGKVVTPGIIDPHSHLGVYPTPDIDALEDGNEMTDPQTPQLSTEHGVWPQDPGFLRALAGGVTTLQVLPGSANLVGGRAVVLHTLPKRTVAEMRFLGAPYDMKMAWGENPRRVYGSKGRMPATRMAEMAMDRALFLRGKAYAKKLRDYEKSHKGDPPERNLQLETIAGVLDGKILVHCHCYRADEMAQVLALAHEMGFKVRSFEHGVEAYKIRDVLAKEGVGVCTWADWWGFKIESYDAIPANIALLNDAGVRVVVHSDSENGIQRLNQEAAKAIASGRAIGLDIPERQAIRWLTSNPAWVLGIEDKTGRLAPGLMGDVVVWDRTPFSVYAHADQVFEAGNLVYDRNDPAVQPRSDFEVGHPSSRLPQRPWPLSIPRFGS